MSEAIPSEYRGWWRITETSQWVNDGLDILGPALLSLTGHGDRLRMHCLLAYVNCKPTKTGVSFTWEGAWEYDQMSGTGRVTLRKDGRLKGTFRMYMFSRPPARVLSASHLPVAEGAVASTGEAGCRRY